MNRRDFLSLLNDRDGTPNADVQVRTKGESSGSALEPFVPSAATPWDYVAAAHLLRRVMSGPTEQEIRTAVREGLHTTVERILTPFDPSTDLIASFAWGEPQTGQPEPEGPRYDAWVWDLLGRRYRLVQWCAKTMVDSPVSIQERMTFFWHDHFATQMGKIMFAEFEFINNQTLRAFALGNFKEMTREITKDPAMLVYLDGETNTKETLNENYARELLELFTVGRVDRDGVPNYTQQDVIAAARALTGWQKQASKLRPDTHQSIYSIFWHHLWDDGEKTFLGRTGKWNADDIIDIIFDVRADQVARFICGKIYRLLVSLTADHDVIDAMAAIFRASNWEIAPVLRALLLSRHFHERENIGCLPKSLLDYLVGLIRSLNVTNIPDFVKIPDRFPHRDLFFRLESYDHLPFHPPNVSGWSDGRAWVTPAALVPRIRFARELARGRVEPVHMDWWESPYRIDPVAFAKSFPNPYDPYSLCDDIALYFLGVPPSPDEREMLYATLLDGGRDYEWDIEDPEQRPDLRLRLFLESLFTLPKFQLY